VSDPIIVVEHLTHIYQAKNSSPLQKAALVDVSLQIERGSCIAIIGVTGSGKSTLVQHFNGLLHPTNGTVIVDGMNTTDKATDLARLRRRVGMLFQYPESQLFERTLYADVSFGPRRMRIGKHEIRRRTLAALDMVGLPHKEYALRNPFELSGGQRRRAALAGVLAMSPKILILDEPTVGLDAEGRSEFYSYLARIKQEQGVTIVLVSHDMTEVATLAEHLFVLRDGRLVMQGEPRAIFALGEALRSYGLAAPPLSELLTLLRQKGIDIPEDVFSLEEAVALLRDRKMIPEKGL
jgi:energy-coupling factor transport system ATP-binding protein